MKHRTSLEAGCWGLERAREFAAGLMARSDRKRAAAGLIALTMKDDAETRKRAADVARRISDRDAGFFRAHADELLGLLAEVPPHENRTRWHLGLVAARVAETPGQIARAAALMRQLALDESNVVRCSAVEGIAELALKEPSLTAEAEAYLREALLTGTPAMKVRARHGLRRIDRDRAYRSGHTRRGGSR